MESEIELYKRVEVYLNKLGYTNNLFNYEFKTPKGERIDILVKSFEETLIAIEVKNNTDIYDLTSKEIHFHPIARKVQQDAISVNAPYFLITNGIAFLWMKTGNNGRPELIEEVKLDQQSGIITRDTKYIDSMLRHVIGFLENFPITGDLHYDFSLVLYLKIRRDRGFNAIEIFEDRNVLFSNNLNIDEVKFRFTDLIERLDGIDFVRERSNILLCLDDFFLKNRKDWYVSRWVTNFMVNLYPKSLNKIKVLDLYAKKGTLISSFFSKGGKDLQGFFLDQKDEYWNKFQYLLWNENEQKIKNVPGLLEDFPKHINIDGQYDLVFLTPPFGFKKSFSGLGKPVDSVELLLSKALSNTSKDGYVIALVNDSILFSSQFAEFRKELINTFSLRGIIRLSTNGLNANSINTSILVIQKGKIERPTFFGYVGENIDNNQETNLPDEVLSRWQNYIKGGNIEEVRFGFLVNNLDFKNLHFSNYWFEKYQDGLKNLKSGFQAIPLKELIVSIQRGAGIKKVEKGNIPYISPGMIRKMELNELELLYSDLNSIKGRKICVDKDDIVVNIIGTQRGSAALINNDYAGYTFNSHVISLKPKVNLVRPYFLCLVLNSDYVQDQFKNVSSATVIPALNLSSFETIFVPIPSFEIQDFVIDEYQKNIFQLQQLELEVNKKKITLNNLLNSLGKEENNL